jgi:hypothetical protein
MFWTSRKANRRPQVTSVHPRLLALEDRCVPAAFTVTSNLDSGPGSLRDILGVANTNGQDDTIGFAASVSSIILTSGELSLSEVGKAITLNGNGGATQINGNNTSRIFTVALGATATLNGLSLLDGNAGAGNGGAILNNGTTFITQSKIFDSVAGKGGGIYSTGILDLTLV